jgi:hypothetical protein
MFYIGFTGSSQQNGLDQLVKEYTTQVNDYWIPYSQIYILLFACAALLSKLIK